MNLELEAYEGELKALRQALGYPTPEQIALAQQIRPKGKSQLSQALAQSEQEPVGWANSSDLQNFDMRVRTNSDHYHTVPLYTAPPSIEAAVLAEREACAKVCDETGMLGNGELGQFWSEKCAAAIRARSEK